MIDNQPGAKSPGQGRPPEHGTNPLAGLSVDQRVALARKPWVGAVGGTPMDADAHAQRLILLAIIQDAEDRVRQALAETLAENQDAPHDIILALANDTDLVAVPALSLSQVLTPDDLVGIIDGLASSGKMLAIAGRKEVPATVGLALIEKGDEATVDRLLRNEGADMTEGGMHRIIDRYGDRENIQKGLIDREMLPATVIERAVALISAHLLTRLVARHHLPVNVAASLALETRDRATLGLTSGLDAEGMNTLVTQLFEEGRLTQSLLLRSLCVGNLELAIHAIAVKCAVSPDYVLDRMTSRRTGEFEKLWARTGLPAKLLPVTEAAIDILVQTYAESEKWDATYYRRRIIQRMISQFVDMSVEFSDEDMEYLIADADKDGAKLSDFVPGESAIPA